MAEPPERRRVPGWAACGAVFVALAVAALGCAERTGSDAEARRLEVHRRLFRRTTVPKATPGQGVVPGRDVVGDCRVGDEIRPALGCPTFIREWRWPRRASTGRAVRRRLRLDESVSGRPLLVERAHRRRDADPWTPLPLLRVRRATANQIVPFDVPAGVRTRAVVHVPGPTAVRRTEIVDVPPEAVLVGGIGLHVLGVRRDVRFRIVATVDGRSSTLLDEVVAHGTSRWHDYRLDVGAFAGRTVRLGFFTSAVGDGEPGAALPLWSRPMVVTPAPAGTGRNVIVVSLDTLRGDYVGGSGGGHAQTPALDALAASGAQFVDAMAPYPSTTASHMSLLTGLYPSVHDVRAPSRVLPTEVRTLAEVLADHGYATAAVTENGMLLARSGFQRGFDSYREFKESLPTMTSGHVEEVTAAGLAWLDAHRGERFLLFLHTYQVHAPYAPPAAFDRRRGRDDVSLAPLERDRLAYAGEVEYTDHVLGEFFRAIDERGLRNRTIVVVTSDHGEAFGEHGLVLHGSWVHDPQIRIPLVIRAPGRVSAGLRSEVPVSLLDVTPTILDLLGLATPPHVQGRTLVPILEGRDDAGLRARAVFAEVGSGRSHTVAARRGDLKWIVDAKGSVRRFDLRTDPGEVAEQTAPADVERGARMVAAFKAEAARLRATVRRTSPPTAPPVDPEAEERLRALGYLE